MFQDVSCQNYKIKKLCIFRSISMHAKEKKFFRTEAVSENRLSNYESPACLLLANNDERPRHKKQFNSSVCHRQTG